MANNLWLVSRRDNLLALHLPRWASLQWTENWQQPGSGRIAFPPSTLSTEAVDNLLGGNAAIIANLETPSGRRSLYGYVVAVTLQSSGNRLRIDTRPVTAVVVTGPGSGANQPVTRSEDATLTALYGYKELVRNSRLSTDGERAGYGLAELSKLARQRRQSSARVALGESEDLETAITVEVRDALGYLGSRWVDAEGVVSVNSGTLTAGAYISDLINSELLTPTAAGRTLEVAAELGSIASGADVLLPVRWVQLGNAIKRAAEYGGVGVKASLATSGTARVIRYEVATPRDRRDDGHARLNARLRPTPGDLEVGDVVTRVSWLSRRSIMPVSSTSEIVSSLAYRASPAQPVSILPTFEEYE